MRYVRVRDKELGHQFSTPEDDPILDSGLVERVGKGYTFLPLPPKPKKNVPPAGGRKAPTAQQGDK